MWFIIGIVVGVSLDRRYPEVINWFVNYVKDAIAKIKSKPGGGSPP